MKTLSPDTPPDVAQQMAALRLAALWLDRETMIEAFG
jgi:hypothetical protein